MGKTFEKQIKTTEDQGERQIKAIQNQEEIETFKKYTYDNENTPLISKKKKIFNELADKRLDEITKLNEKVNFDDLIYRYKGNTADLKLNQFDNAFSKMREGKISLTDAKNNQAIFLSDLNEINRGNKKHRPKEQKNSIV